MSWLNMSDEKLQLGKPVKCALYRFRSLTCSSGLMKQNSFFMLVQLFNFDVTIHCTILVEETTNVFGWSFPWNWVVVQHDAGQLFFILAVEGNADCFGEQRIHMSAEEQIITSCMIRTDVHHLLQAVDRCCQQYQVITVGQCPVTVQAVPQTVATFS